MHGNRFIKYYLYEYIASFVRDYSRFGNIDDYKKYVAKNILDYLRIESKGKILYYILVLTSKFQILLSVPIVLFYLFKYSLNYVGRNRVSVVGKRVVLDLVWTQELFSKAQFPLEDLVVVRMPFKNKYFDDTFESVDLLNCVPYSALLKSFWLSIKLIFIQYFKYGKRELLFRNYASYDFFIACYYFSTIDPSNKIVFTSTYDKWAYLFASLDNYKIFVQHGYLSRLFYCKSIGAVDECYCLNEEQIECCRMKLFTNNPPRQFVMKGMNFTAQEKIIHNGKKNVLVVANLLFQDTQEYIIRSLCQKSGDYYNIYVKPHPLDNKEPYNRLKEHFPCLSLLEKTEFPPVDLLISYESTLAFEYMGLGVPSLFYDKPGFESQFEILCKGDIPIIKS